MFCNYCGASNPDDAIFCSACGKQMVHPSAAETHLADSKLSREAATEVPASIETASPAPYVAPPGPEVNSKGKGGSVLWAVGGLILLVAIIGVVAITRGRSGAPNGGPSGYTPASSSSSSSASSAPGSTPLPPGTSPTTPDGGPSTPLGQERSWAHGKRQCR